MFLTILEKFPQCKVETDFNSAVKGLTAFGFYLM